MLLNSREFKFLKNYRNVYVKSSAKREYRDENASSKLITLLILNKKDFNHFFKGTSSDIVLLKLGNLFYYILRNLWIVNDVMYLNYIDQVVWKFAKSQQALGAEMPRLVTTYLNFLLQAPLEMECFYRKFKEFCG